jgi:hypothetical protein
MRLHPKGDGWVRPYTLRPRSRATLLGVITLKADASEDELVRRAEDVLGTFVALRDDGSFAEHPEPSAETRRKLERFAKAERLFRAAGRAYAEAADELSDEAAERVALAWLRATRDDRAPGETTTLAPIMQRLRSASLTKHDSAFDESKTLGDFARYAISEMEGEREHGRGPKPDRGARFLLFQAMRLWDEFSALPIARGWGDDPGPLLPFVRWFWDMGGIGSLRGDKMVREYLALRRHAKALAEWPRT